MVLAGAGAFIWSWWQDEPAPADLPEKPAATTAPAPAAGKPPAPPAPASEKTATKKPAAVVTKKPPVPASLQGTSVPPGLQTDSTGQLIVNRALRDMIEYFLSTRGEASDEQIRELAAHHFAELGGATAAAEAMEIFDAYQNYTDALAAAGTSETNNLSPDEKLSILEELRQEHFTDEVLGEFFKFDMIYDRFTAQRLNIINDPELSTEDKKQLVQDLIEELPPEVREKHGLSTGPIELQDTTKKRREEGATDGEIEGLRRDTYGEDAARRLGDLDEERDAWRQRLEAYQNTVAEIRDSDLEDEEKERLVRELLEESFDENERRRVLAGAAGGDADRDGDSH